MMVCDSKAGDEQAKILHQELPTRGQEKTACFFLEILNIREQAECDQEGQHAKQTAQKAKTGKEDAKYQKQSGAQLNNPQKYAEARRRHQFRAKPQDRMPRDQRLDSVLFIAGDVPLRISSTRS